MVQQEINLCLVFPDGDGWTGETNYLISLISSLKIIKKKKFNFFILCSKKKENYLSKHIKKKNIISSYFFEKNSIKEKFRKLIKFFFKKDLILYYYLNKYKINVISHYEPVNSISSICWIPDFQHLYLKKFFSKNEIQRRDRLFLDYIKRASSIVVSSNDAYSHLKKNYNINKIKTNILNFVPKIDIDNIKSLRFLEIKYKIKKNFIYVPNQFWKHKNHSILIECAKLLKKKNFKVKFIITGNPSKGQDNKVYLNFISKINKFKLNNYFNLLGFVPYEHVVSLLFHSNILINPSLFEGWSTTVEEGKILGKKMILSNLNVHKEQAPIKAIFFNPNNAEDLTKKIIKLHNIKDNNLKISTLKKKYKKDRTYFANQFLTIIKNSL